MFTFKTLTFTSMLLALSQAAPAVIARQDIKLLSLCNNPDQGNCLDFQTTPDICSNIPQGWNDNVSSLDTFDDSSFCTFFNNPNCDESAGSITLSGAQDSLPVGFDNSLSSVRCNICWIPEGCS